MSKCYHKNVILDLYIFCRTLHYEDSIEANIRSQEGDEIKIWILNLCYNLPHYYATDTALIGGNI